MRCVAAHPRGRLGDDVYRGWTVKYAVRFDCYGGLFPPVCRDTPEFVNPLAKRVKRARRCSSSGIADGPWHSLTCERYPELLRLMMDGGEMVSQQVPAGRQIANDLPLHLGSKGT
jgi:hypothetical protein